MKIVCVTPDDFSTLIMCKTLSRLLARRPDMTLVTIGGPVQGRPEDLYREDIRTGVISKHIEIPMNQFISPARDLAYMLRLYRVIREERCDAVITFATKPNIFGQIAAFLAGAPLRVMAVRGLGRTFNAAAGAKERALQSVMKTLYRLVCRMATRVWFTSQADLSALVSTGICSPGKTFLTTNAIDLTDFCNERIDPARLAALREELGLVAGDKVVIMVARLIAQKGHREFAEAAVALREKFPRLRFLLVAPEEPDNPGRVSADYLREMESRSNLRWLGFRKDVRELYALSDLAVLPSYYKEGGYPRGLLEAMAYGKPVIAADTPECRGPVEAGQNGFLVPPRDAAALAKAIETIVADSELSSTMGRRSLVRVREKFNDSVVFDSLIDQVILSPSRSPS